MLSYQNADSKMTLQEAIEELRRAENAEIYLPESLSPEMRGAIDAHDAVHALFALDTSESDEVVAHAFMVFGTTVTMKELKQVAGHFEHRRMTTDAGHFKMLKTAAFALPKLAKAIFLSLRMKKRFPWQNYKEHLNRRLLEIREEFGIRVSV